VTVLLFLFQQHVDGLHMAAPAASGRTRQAAHQGDTVHRLRLHRERNLCRGIDRVAQQSGEAARDETARIGTRLTEAHQTGGNASRSWSMQRAVGRMKFKQKSHRGGKWKDEAVKSGGTRARSERWDMRGVRGLSGRRSHDWPTRHWDLLLRHTTQATHHLLSVESRNSISQ
jgi:hypothetical protein